MSIIMEALKKASNRPAPEKEPAAEARVIIAPEIHDPKFSKSFVMMFSTIIVIAAVAYFTGTSKHSPAKTTNLAQHEFNKTAKAEGYSPTAMAAPVKQEPTPVSNLLTKLSNPHLTLNGIVYGIGKPAAIIENKIIEEGGSIKGMRVVKIHTDRVEMLDQATGQPFVLKVD
jgi:hypothetical protein